MLLFFLGPGDAGYTSKGILCYFISMALAFIVFDSKGGTVHLQVLRHIDCCDKSYASPLFGSDVPE